MIKLFSMEFWMGVQFFIDLVFVVFLFRLVKRLRQDIETPGELNPGTDRLNHIRDETIIKAHEIMEIMEPLVHEAESAGDSFNQQIKEKKNIIKNLNDALDSRIISINLLLSRAEALLFSQQQAPVSEKAYTAFDGRNLFGHANHDVFDQQNEILDLHSKGCSTQSIATRLSIPEGEVELVINLKEKFIKMGNQV